MTLDGMARVRPDDARVALMRAGVYRKLGEFEPMLAAAALSSRLAGARGSRGTLASARLGESSACLSLGRNKEAQAAADEARRLFVELGDRGGAARSLEAVALSVQATGDLVGSQRLLERALAEHEAIGNKGSAARVLNNLGRICCSAWRPPRSAEPACSSREGMSLLPRSSPRPRRRWPAPKADTQSRADALLVTAEVALAEGNGDRARSVLQEAEKTARESDEAALGLAAAILAGRLLALSSDGSLAARRATARGQTLIALEARVEAVRLAVDPGAGRDLAERAALTADLRRRGLGRLERRLGQP